MSEKLKTYLSELATNQKALGEFLQNPDAAMKKARLDQQDVAALKSGNPALIQSRLGPAGGAASGWGLPVFPNFPLVHPVWPLITPPVHPVWPMLVAPWTGAEKVAKGAAARKLAAKAKAEAAYYPAWPPPLIHPVWPPPPIYPIWPPPIHPVWPPPPLLIHQWPPPPVIGPIGPGPLERRAIAKVARKRRAARKQGPAQ